MPSAADIHEMLKAYMKVVANADGAILLEQKIVQQFNTLMTKPDDRAAYSRLQQFLGQQVSVHKGKGTVATDLELVLKAAKLGDTKGSEKAKLLGLIKAEDAGVKPAKLLGTGNQIAQVIKLPPFRPAAEQGDLNLRSLLVNLATNPDLKMKAGEDDGKEMEDDRTRWGVARLTGKMVIPEDNTEEFRSAAASTIWLGFVRIGRRVDRQEDRITLVQLTPEKQDERRYQTSPQALVVGQTWHNVWLNKYFSAKTDPKVKQWNGWTLQALKTDQRIALSDTGCYFGFFLIKAKGDGTENYWNFRCASLNRPANAQVADNVPDMPPGKMTPDQRNMYQNMLTAARGNHTLPVDEIKAMFKGVKLHRATLGLQDASKKMPLSWAKAVYETIGKISK